MPFCMVFGRASVVSTAGSHLERVCSEGAGEAITAPRSHVMFSVTEIVW